MANSTKTLEVKINTTLNDGFGKLSAHLSTIVDKLQGTNSMLGTMFLSQQKSAQATLDKLSALEAKLSGTSKKAEQVTKAIKNEAKATADLSSATDKVTKAEERKLAATKKAIAAQKELNAEIVKARKASSAYKSAGMMPEYLESRRQLARNTGKSMGLVGPSLDNYVKSTLKTVIASGIKSGSISISDINGIQQKSIAASLSSAFTKEEAAAKASAAAKNKEVSATNSVIAAAKRLEATLINLSQKTARAASNRSSFFESSRKIERDGALAARERSLEFMSAERNSRLQGMYSNIAASNSLNYGRQAYSNPKLDLVRWANSIPSYSDTIARAQARKSDIAKAFGTPARVVPQQSGIYTAPIRNSYTKKAIAAQKELNAEIVKARKASSAYKSAGMMPEYLESRRQLARNTGKSMGLIGPSLDNYVKSTLKTVIASGIKSGSMSISDINGIQQKSIAASLLSTFKREESASKATAAAKQSEVNATNAVIAATKRLEATLINLSQKTARAASNRAAFFESSNSIEKAGALAARERSIAFMSAERNSRLQGMYNNIAASNSLNYGRQAYSNPKLDLVRWANSIPSYSDTIARGQARKSDIAKAFGTTARVVPQQSGIYSAPINNTPINKSLNSIKSFKMPIEPKHVDLITRLNKGIMKTGELLFRLQYAFLTFIAPFAALGAVADKWTEVTVAINRATSTTEEYSRALNDVKAISSNTYSSLSSTANLYSKLAQDAKKYNLSQDQLGKMTENVAVLVAASGGSQESRDAAMQQFTQAYASNKFGGDELRSVFENAPLLAKALAQGIQGKKTLAEASMGDLRTQASSKKGGGVTGDLMVKALLDPNVEATVIKYKNSIAPTFQGALQLIVNSTQEAVGKFAVTSGILSKVMDAAKVAAEAIQPDSYSKIGRLSENLIKLQEQAKSLTGKDLVNNKDNQSAIQGEIDKTKKIQNDANYLKSILAAIMVIIGLLMAERLVRGTNKFLGENFSGTMRSLSRAGNIGTGIMGPVRPVSMELGKELTLLASTQLPVTTALFKTLRSSMTALTMPFKSVANGLASIGALTVSTGSIWKAILTVVSGGIRSIAVGFVELVGGPITLAIAALIALGSWFVSFGLKANNLTVTGKTLQGVLLLIGDGFTKASNHISNFVDGVKSSFGGLASWLSNVLANYQVFPGVTLGMVSKYTMGQTKDIITAANERADYQNDVNSRAQRMKEGIFNTVYGNPMGPGFGDGTGITKPPAKDDGPDKTAKALAKKFDEAVKSATEYIDNLNESNNIIKQTNAYNSFYMELANARKDGNKSLTSTFKDIKGGIPANIQAKLDAALEDQKVSKLNRMIVDSRADNIWSNRILNRNLSGQSDISNSIDLGVVDILKKSLNNFNITSELEKEFNLSAMDSTTGDLIDKFKELATTALLTETNIEAQNKLRLVLSNTIDAVNIKLRDFALNIKSSTDSLIKDNAVKRQQAYFSASLSAQGIFGNKASYLTDINNAQMEEKQFLLGLGTFNPKEYANNLNLSVEELYKSIKDASETNFGSSKTTSTNKIGLSYTDSYDPSMVEVRANKVPKDALDDRYIAYLEKIKLLTDQHNAQLEMQKNYWLGAKDAVESYLESIKDIASQMKSIMSNALSGLEDKLTELFSTGRIQGGLRGLLQGITTEINRMMVRQFIMPTIISGAQSLLSKIPFFNKWIGAQKSSAAGAANILKGDGSNSTIPQMTVSANVVNINGTPYTGNGLWGNGKLDEDGTPIDSMPRISNSDNGVSLSKIFKGKSVLDGLPGSTENTSIPQANNMFSGLLDSFKGMFSGIFGTILNFIKGMMGGAGGGIASFLQAFIHHDGGQAGTSIRTRALPSALFGKIGPNEVPVLARNDETILTAQQMRGIRNNLASSSIINSNSVSFSPSVTVNYTGNEGAANNDGKEIANIVSKSVEAKFYDLMAKESRQGGMLRR